ncbi:hypothetical protein VFPPC_07321 [Pochonia chlamydosporia 170]|uniref:Uncharacterized protein n=1 Tax=Pochonia chlamydosporia 170 TaxID=1380566 RepID=A0A179F9M4_METCM|nr:hypothetical protein VFPPC_07321 [Pochonia chlamydosporia 170]OAQ61981.1 hypothetical protein VFPPC_07321 [Pochonia chlamydosporia 170]
MSPKKTKTQSQKQAGNGRQQLWFFLNEGMNRNSFTQGAYTFEEVKKHTMSLQTCIKLSGGKGTVEEHSFYIHSDSMSSAVQMLNDESIIATYNLYCTKDNVVTVIVRKATEPSPNSSRTPSHANSRSSRRSLSASHGISVPEVLIQPKIRHRSESTDMETMEKIEDERNMVSMVSNENVMTFTKDYLLGWIESQLTDLKNPTEVTVHSIGPSGISQPVQLTADIWQRNLLRGPWKEPFIRIWDDFIRAESKKEEMLSEIMTNNPRFHQGCLEFIYDLRNYGNNKGSRARLEGNGHKFYIGAPYFDDATRDRILQLPNYCGTLQLALEDLERKRSGSSICASHDLSPIFESALGVS